MRINYTIKHGLTYPRNAVYKTPYDIARIYNIKMHTSYMLKTKIFDHAVSIKLEIKTLKAFNQNSLKEFDKQLSQVREILAANIPYLTNLYTK